MTPNIKIPREVVEKVCRELRYTSSNPFIAQVYRDSHSAALALLAPYLEGEG